jgi:hypothetical protein
MVALPEITWRNSLLSATIGSRPSIVSASLEWASSRGAAVAAGWTRENAAL